MGSTYSRCAWVTFAVICAILLLAPAAVFAQEEGVHYDRDSPAGKEYALPLPSARDGGRASDEPVLFGAGITKAGGTHGSSDAEESLREAHSDDTSSASEKDTNSPEGSDSRPTTRLADAGAPASSKTGLLIGVGSGVLVLALGSGVWFAARRPDRG